MINQEREFYDDVSFPKSAREIEFEHDLTDDEVLLMRSRYLGYAFGAMARFSRGSVLIQDVQVVTKEMLEAALVEGNS